jgi:putative transposase
MDRDLQKHRPRSIRLKDYDYSQAGAYFITVCAHTKEYLFGNVVDGRMQLSKWGCIVNEFWKGIPLHFQNIEIDASVVMPNHIHAIIFIGEFGRGGVSPPEVENPLPLQKVTLGKVLAYYKYQTTKLINQARNSLGKSVWQRNYYDHVIRNDVDLSHIREYILWNPLKWELDSENPAKQKLLQGRGLPAHRRRE